jgi:glycosyltransferase involved in cell wall biosynthesis
MNSPKVSVIIPTYNGKEHLGEAIQSVLDQTYQNFELLVVNDASPDDPAEVMAKFDDPRIRYIVHERNRGVDQARSTGIRSSSGEIVAFLDQDDYYHPEKLEAHVGFYEQHPKVGFTYNARFELNYSAKSIRTIWRPSRNITLADLVLWFPIAPSDWFCGGNGQTCWSI